MDLSKGPTRAGSAGDGPVELTDSRAALQQVLENLKQAIEESHGKVTYDPLPVALVRPRHLEQLFQNLISNSLKYRKESESPRIHIRAARQGSSWRFSVADNGIGIAPEYHDKVFGGYTATTTGTPEPASGWRSVTRSWSATATASGSYGGSVPEASSTAPFPPHLWCC